MTDRRILFNGQMVNALLDGRKTQTRRVIKPQPPEDAAPSNIVGPAWYAPSVIDKNGDEQPGDDVFGFYDLEGEWGRKLPHAIGDHLWVREAWRADRGLDRHSGAEIERLCAEEAGYDHCWAAVFYEANETWSRREAGTVGGRYRHARFMPRWASRLTLIVTEVRVQRLKSMVFGDIWAEGITNIQTPRGAGETIDERQTRDVGDTLTNWKVLWDSINAKPKPVGGKTITHYESYPTDGIARTETYRDKPHIITPNPWVAAYTFTLHKANIDKMETAA